MLLKLLNFTKWYRIFNKYICKRFPIFHKLIIYLNQTIFHLSFPTYWKVLRSLEILEIFQKFAPYLFISISPFSKLFIPNLSLYQSSTKFLNCSHLNDFHPIRKKFVKILTTRMLLWFSASVLPVIQAAISTAEVPPPVVPRLLQVRPGGGLRVVRSLGVARLVAGVVGTGLLIGVTRTVRVKTLIGRLDHCGQVAGSCVRSGQEPVPGRRDGSGAVRGSARVRGRDRGGRGRSRRQCACQRRESWFRLETILADQHLHSGHHVACDIDISASFHFPWLFRFFFFLFFFGVKNFLV